VAATGVPKLPVTRDVYQAVLLHCTPGPTPAHARLLCLVVLDLVRRRKLDAVWELLRWLSRQCRAGGQNAGARHYWHDLLVQVSAFADNTVHDYHGHRGLGGWRAPAALQSAACASGMWAASST